MEEQLRQELAVARQKEEDGHQQQLSGEAAAQIKQEAWEAWQRLETHLRRNGRSETLDPKFGAGDHDAPGMPISGVAPVMRGQQDNQEREEISKS
jgi:hypothetical protein